MTTYLKCPKCKFGFAMSTMEYMAKGAVCPRCGATEKKDASGRTIYVQ